eukprot:g16505.t1
MRFVDVFVPVSQEQIVEVPKIEYVDKIVEVPQVKKVTKYVEVPEIRYVDKVVDVPKIICIEKVIEICRDSHEQVMEDGGACDPMTQSVVHAWDLQAGGIPDQYQQVPLPKLPNNDFKAVPGHQNLSLTQSRLGLSQSFDPLLTSGAHAASLAAGRLHIKPLSTGFDFGNFGAAGSPLEN